MALYIFFTFFVVNLTTELTEKQDASPWLASRGKVGSGFNRLEYLFTSRSAIYRPKGVDIRLKAILQEFCTEFNAELLEIEVMPDHVHLLVGVDPQFGIAKLIRYLKGRSSRLLHLKSLNQWYNKRFFLERESTSRLLVKSISQDYREKK